MDESTSSCRSPVLVSISRDSVKSRIWGIFDAEKLTFNWNISIEINFLHSHLRSQSSDWLLLLGLSLAGYRLRPGLGKVGLIFVRGYLPVPRYIGSQQRRHRAWDMKCDNPVKMIQFLGWKDWIFNKNLWAPEPFIPKFVNDSVLSFFDSSILFASWFWVYVHSVRRAEKATKTHVQKTENDVPVVSV